MSLKYSKCFIVVLMIAFASCSAHTGDVAWPEPRPLGNDLKAYRPPPDPSEVVTGALSRENSEGILTLRQVLSLALMRNPELASFSWEVRMAEARTLQAGLLPNPEIEIAMEEFGGARERSDFDAMETTFALSHLFELGGKRSKRTRLAALERDLAGWDYEAKRLDVLTEATKAFVEVLAAQEGLTLTRELIDLSEKTFTTASKRVRAGKVSPLEETRARVAYASSQIELERANRDLEAARKNLAALWGQTSPAFEKAAGELDAVKPIPNAEQFADLISQNPDIVRWAVEAERRRAALELEEARQVPDLTLSGGLKRFNETDDNAFVAGISVPIPVFDRNQGGILETRYRLAQTEKQRQAAEVRIQNELSDAYRSLSGASFEATALKNEVLPGAQSAFDAASEGYRQGKFNYLDVLDTQRTLIEFKVEHLRALSAYHKAKTDIERLIGEELAIETITSQ
jgi:cobalt-zinc-cadmium efflux system outer membrane protein